MLLIFFVGVLALGIALLPLAALIGAIYGGCAAPSAEEVEQGLSTLRRSISESHVSRRIAERIFDVGRTRSDASLVIVEPGAPRPPCDTILEVGQPALSLVGPYNVNPALRLMVSVPVRLIRVSDGTLLHEFTLLRSRATEAEFLQWAAGGGQAVRAELESAPGDFAGRFVEEIFLLHLLPLDRLWKPSP